MSQIPFIVLLGDVGTGKSTIVEKLTGARGRSSASSTSVTISSEAFESFDEKMIICDTPGSNSMKDKFKHNLHIAHAMNFHPVTCVMIIVKADVRMDNVVQHVTQYAEGFLPEDIPMELIGVCVTHMDEVKWTKGDLLPHLTSELGINTAIFSSIRTTRDTLSRDIMAECADKRPVELSIDGDMFLKLFKISNNNLKVLRQTRKEVGRFEKMKQDFYKQKKAHTESDQMNMTFDFQTWVLEQIIEAQKSLSSSNNFTFIEGPNMENEAGHIANMTNQLRKVLSDVRIEASKYHKDVDTNFRKCPHCGAVWQKIEGCDGGTTCGNRPSLASDIWSDDMSMFSFKWDSTAENLIIRKLGGRQLKASSSNRAGKSAGCGLTIEWSKMMPVKVEVEFDISPSSTKDVTPLPSPARETWNEGFDKAIKSLPKLSVRKVGMYNFQ